MCRTPDPDRLVPHSSNLLRAARLTGNTCYLLMFCHLLQSCGPRGSGTRSARVGGEMQAEPAAMSAIIRVVFIDISQRQLLSANERNERGTKGWECGSLLSIQLTHSVERNGTERENSLPHYCLKSELQLFDFYRAAWNATRS